MKITDLLELDRRAKALGADRPRHRELFGTVVGGKGKGRSQFKGI